MAYVSHANGSATSSGTTTSSGALNVTAGRTVVVVWSTQEDGGQTHTCADTAGNTYGSPVVQVGSFGERLKIWVVHNCLGHASNVVTVTSSGAHRYKYIDQVQLDPGGTGTTDDSDSEENAGSTDGTCPAMDATGAGTVVYGTASTNDRSWTPDTNFTELTDFASGLSTGYRDVTGSGSFTAGATASGTSNVSVGAVIVKDAAAGATVRPRSLLLTGAGC